MIQVSEPERVVAVIDQAAKAALRDEANPTRPVFSVGL